ncbi:MAG: Universal stress protein [Elusimicrobia bacterium]|nr:Universal stress protein [Elusimicrobiota bacterium]
MKEKMKLLIGYDGSPASNEALEDLKRAGLPQKLEAVVLTATQVVIPPYTENEYAALSPSHRESIENERKQALLLARQGMERLKILFPLWEVQAESSGESPAWALINKAEAWSADLIVVGAHGHSAVGLYLGSVSQLVLMHAACSVRVARKSLNANQNEGFRLIIGVDGSTGSEKALAVLQQREWPLKSEVRIVSVLQHHLSLYLTHMVPPNLRMVDTVTGLERQSMNQMVESLASRLRSQQMEASGYVREGDPKSVLISEAETWKADCLFLGARGLSPLNRFLLGSVSMGIAARARCSVEIVRG